MPKVLDYQFPTEQMLFTTKQLNELGISFYGIKKLVKDGTLIKLSCSVYENATYEGEESDCFYVTAYAPDGVVCQMSAARYYGLTTYWPDAVDVAIERRKKLSTVPDFPKFNVVYYSKKRYELGIETITEGRNGFRIYDMEKTVADILFYRNKVGIEETKEILVNYLARKERNLNKLHRYAKELRCEKILSTYLEVLL